MRQFDVVENPVARLRQMRPYLVLVQAASIGPRSQRIFMPLTTVQIVKDTPRLMPEFNILNRPVWLAPFDPAVLSLSAVGEPIASLIGDRDRIIAAIDLIFTGV